MGRLKIRTAHAKAIDAGDKTYKSREACARCGNRVRHTSNRACFKCTQMNLTEWRKLNKDRIAKRSKLWRENNAALYMWNKIKIKAARDGIRFNLRVSDIEVPTHCPILGIRLVTGIKYSHDASPTVDRINSKKGYVTGNVAVISRKANTLKGHASSKEHLLIAKWMQSHGA